MSEDYPREGRNILRCPSCGAGILTKADERACYKCDTPMIFERKE